MSSDDQSDRADARIASLTGEFADPALELRYRRVRWTEQSRQVRIVCLISVFAYLFAFYQNYLDLGQGERLSVIAACRLTQFALLGWAVYRTYAKDFSSRLQYVVFAAEFATGVSETLEMVQYQQAGLLTDLTAVPFFAFIILIFYMFLPIRWALTTAASLLGSAVLVIGYAYVADWQLAHIIRHPVVLLGVIAIGAGAVRVMNHAQRRNWLQGKLLEAEIVERRRAEAKALEASRVKGEFLAVMSHEIRTPLNSILAMAEVLSADSGLQGERSRRQLHLLSTAGRHLNDLVDDILDFSRLEARVDTFEPEPFRLQRTVRNAMAAVENLAKQKGLALQVTIDGALPERVLGNKQRIRQILINLVGNAIKFTDAGQVDVRVEPVNTADSVRFEISDTGIGVPPAELERIFEPFQQADASSTRQYQGTGLGLAISRNLVQQMGGHIGARNRPEGGAVFEFVLPLPIADAAAGHGDAVPTAQPITAPRGGFRALVVEDSELNRMVVEEYLAGVACTLQFAADGAAGVAAFRSAPFDIVLMDLQMPGMDGITATASIRAWEREEARQATPIVIITADSLAQTRQRAEAAGVSGYLTKPMSRADLFGALHRHLSAEAAPAETPADAGSPLAPLLPRYFEQMARDLATMAQALADDDRKTLATLAHAAKGHSQMFGFPQLATLAAQLEQTAKAAAAPGLQNAWEALHASFAATAQRRAT